MRLINNTNKPNDRMFKILKDYGKNTSVYIASAFFHDYKTVLNMVENGCEVSIIVRLDMGTSADALSKVINNNKVHIRFFTGTNFHPKFYIFGEQIALIGSSNLTKSGLSTNQEANIEIESENPVFEEIKEAFNEYWVNAEPLDEENLKKFADIIKNFPPPEPWRIIENELGSFQYNNVGRDKQRGEKESLYVSSSKRAYQLYLSKFNTLINMYKSFGLRRYADIPLRIEVDRFLWWIREVQAKGDTYKDVPIASDDEISQKIESLMPEFMAYTSDYLDNEVVPQYQTFVQTFKTADQILELDIDTFYNNLLKVHAFHDCFRYFSGGHPTMKEEFLSHNTFEKITKTITYILFGTEPYQTRIMNCIFNKNYKLKGFGESCVKEIFGLLNNEDIPVSNGRTKKSMEWLGFGKL